MRKWWHLLLPWHWRSSNQKKSVVMFTRRGCHLCDDAWSFLLSEQTRYHFSLEKIDIEEANLEEEYGEMIPVITIDGKLRFHGRINPVLFHRLMR